LPHKANTEAALPVLGCFGFLMFFIHGQNIAQREGLDVKPYVLETECISDCQLFYYSLLCVSQVRAIIANY
jgi:hypothetical protein